MLTETVASFNLTVYQENAAVSIPKIHGIALRKHCNFSNLEFPALSFMLIKPSGTIRLP